MKGFLLFLLGLASGAVAVLVVPREQTDVEPVAAQVSPEPVDAPSTNSAGEELSGNVPAENLTPEQEVRVLRRRVIARDREIARLKESAGQGEANPTNINRRSWFEELQTSDPERYKELVERREQGRQATRYQIAMRAAHFLNKDRAGLSEEEQEQRAIMFSLLDDSLELADKIRSDMPEQERREISRQLRENMRELGPLMDLERDRELLQLGLDIGYDETNAADFVVLVNEIHEMTSISSMLRDSIRQMNGWDGWGRRGEDRGSDSASPAR